MHKNKLANSKISNHIKVLETKIPNQAVSVQAKKISSN